MPITRRSQLRAQAAREHLDHHEHERQQQKPHHEKSPRKRHRTPSPTSSPVTNTPRKPSPSPPPSQRKRPSSLHSIPRLHHHRRQFPAASRPLTVILPIVISLTVCIPLILRAHLPLPLAARGWRWGDGRVFLMFAGGTPSDDEGSVTRGRLSLRDGGRGAQHDDERERQQIITCMPTVRRPNGVEYVSNAVKSWRLATKYDDALQRLIVFQMDVDTAIPTHQANGTEGHSVPAGSNTSHNASSSLPHWVSHVFDRAPRHADELPYWLGVRWRKGMPRPARKLTLGDNEQRVAWRSKEAQDYAQVLGECVASGGDNVRYVLIVQDDVLFTSQMRRLVSWADANFADGQALDKRTGKMRLVRTCSLSLFDVLKRDGEEEAAEEEEDVGDGHELKSSNMVARLWKVQDVQRVARIINYSFDEAPVDWLTDNMCRARRRVTRVMEPNAVRHRGSVSSFVENKREGLLT